MIALKRIDKMIATTVLSAVGLVWAVVLGIDVLFSFARELDEIGRGDYTLGAAITYIAWTIPRRAYDLFVWAAIIGGLLGLGTLAPTAELTAMRAGGMSKLRICLSVVAVVAVLMAFVSVVGETAGPYGESRAQALATGAISKDLIASGKTGLWAREGDSLINAKRGRDDADGTTLFQVRVYEFTEAGRLLRITAADRAEHRGGRWVLLDATRMVFGEETVETEQLARAEWASTLDPRLLTLSIVRPRWLAASDLSANIDYMRRNQLDAGPFESAYWARVFYPFNVLILAFSVLPFAFGALRSGGLSKRLFIGVVVAITWYLFQRAVVDIASVYGVDYRLAHLLPALIVGTAAGIYFRRA
ncbi:MAG TPA: LPS export ABC transporter permease LptG [Xanthomonadales bacterium]|nr:LPS export ABC transporter permease LptG [Xanthomonadales bacterium]